MTNDKRNFGLSIIASTIQSWIDWNIKQRNKEGLDTPPDTHVMQVPAWPSIDVLRNWVKILSTEKTDWINVKDRLPIVPKGKFCIPVLAVHFDKTYHELTGNGYYVSETEFDGKHFKDIGMGRSKWEWYDCFDPVTHWMPLPKHPDKD